MKIVTTMLIINLKKAKLGGGGAGWGARRWGNVCS